jgi:pimeloyl-ACP methyl ester carboxylesterase
MERGSRQPTLQFRQRGSTGSGTAYAYLQGLRWTDFTGVPAGNQVTVTLTVALTNGSVVASANFLVRPPPVVLVHGIADDGGTWSYAFTSRLAQYRPADFIVPISYGTGVGPIKNLWPNATAPLEVLAPLLDQALQSQFETPLHVNWAFTRYDVVGHSQGGVLSRMLCQNVPNSSLRRFVPNPVVSQANFYRERFHRVIIIGSPQNGSLIGWYVWKVRSSIDPADSGWFSQLQLGLFNVLAVIATDKFDPFGTSIAEINNSAYPIDQRIKFNCIQTAIAGGAPPIQTFNPLAAPGCYYISGLCFPTSLSGQSRGQVILPDGSDGVVEYDSEGGGTGTARTQITDNNIAHADFVPLFGVPAGQSQTTYPEVADTVGGLLNASASRFGPFKLPSQLSSATEQTYENTLILGTAVMNLINLLPVPHIPSTNVNYSLQVATNLPNAGPINWFAQVLGTNGLSTNGVTVAVNTNNSTLVTVSVAGTVQGQVLLYASYVATNGIMVYARPVVVVSAPAGTTLSGIELNPTTATLSVGATLPTCIWGDYTNGARCLLYIPSGQVQYTSSNPKVATIDAGGTITMNAFGTATVFANYSGFSAQVIVASTTPSIGNLSGIRSTNKTFQLSFTGTVGTTNVIEASTNLVNWVPIVTLYNTNGFLQFLDVTASNYPVRFYRVKITNAGSTTILPFVWISSQSRLTNGAFQFSLTGTAGVTNIIEASTNLTSWTSLQTVLNTNGSIFFVDQSATNARQKFYRVVIPK